MSSSARAQAQYGIQHMFQFLAGFFPLNPYRAGRRPAALFAAALRLVMVQIELALILTLPAYRRYLRARIKRPVDLMVVGGQKAGTTWLHTQLRAQGLAATPACKESHQFDRGRMGTMRRYLRQFEGLPPDLPVIEVAPDYGPLALWRIRAIKALFADLQIVFILRNPVLRAWSGTRMETAFDGARRAEEVPVRDLIDHLRLPRSRAYSDYAGQIGRWRAVFGVDRVHVFPFEAIAQHPTALLQAICACAGAASAPAILPGAPVFQGGKGPMPVSVRHLLQRQYAPAIEALNTVLPQTFDPGLIAWPDLLATWRAEARDLADPPPKSRHVLVICGFDPNPKATSSGQKLAHRRIMALAEHFARVEVICFVNARDRLDGGKVDWPSNVHIRARLDLRTRDRVLGALRWPALPNMAAARRWRARHAVTAALADPQLTDFHAEFAQGLGAVPAACLPMFSYRQHDIVSRLYARRAGQARGPVAAFFHLERWRCARWEDRAWSGAMRVETLAQEDSTFIATRHPGALVTTDQVRGTLAPGTAVRSPKTVVPGRLMFWGNMSRAENIDAVIYMARTVLPRLRAAGAMFEFWIVGAHPAPSVQALAGKDIHITGFVEDPAPIFATIDLAVVPLRLGSGVKIKVYETLDAGLPTLCSPVGAEGIPPHDLLQIAGDEETFIRALLDHLPAGRGPHQVDA